MYLQQGSLVLIHVLIVITQQCCMWVWFGPHLEYCMETVSRYYHIDCCAVIYIQLLQTDRAVQMLLETDSSSDNYYTDALRYTHTYTST